MNGMIPMKSLNPKYLKWFFIFMIIATIIFFYDGEQYYCRKMKYNANDLSTPQWKQSITFLDNNNLEQPFIIKIFLNSFNSFTIMNVFYSLSILSFMLYVDIPSPTEIFIHIYKKIYNHMHK